MSQTFSIQPAKTDEQIKDIADLAEIIWSQHFTPIIGKEQVDYIYVYKRQLLKRLIYWLCWISSVI